MRTQLLSLIYKGQEVENPIEYYSKQTCEAEGNEDDFSTEDEDSSSDGEETSDKEVADRVMACGPPPDDTDTIRESKQAHLPPEQREHLRATILKYDIIARDLHDLRPANVPLKHTFTLADYTPTASPVCRMNPAHRTEVLRQINEMLVAGLITESNCPWAFHL